MSLVAFFVIGGGGLGTAIGSRILSGSSLTGLFTVYAVGLLALIFAVIEKGFVI